MKMNLRILSSCLIFTACHNSSFEATSPQLKDLRSEATNALDSKSVSLQNLKGAISNLVITQFKIPAYGIVNTPFNITATVNTTKNYTYALSIDSTAKDVTKWSNTIPTSYTMSKIGINTLYLFAKINGTIYNRSAQIIINNSTTNSTLSSTSQTHFSQANIALNIPSNNMTQTSIIPIPIPIPIPNTTPTKALRVQVVNPVTVAAPAAAPAPVASTSVSSIDGSSATLADPRTSPIQFNHLIDLNIQGWMMDLDNSQSDIRLCRVGGNGLPNSCALDLSESVTISGIPASGANLSIIASSTSVDPNEHMGNATCAFSVNSKINNGPLYGKYFVHNGDVIQMAVAKSQYFENTTMCEFQIENFRSGFILAKTRSEPFNPGVRANFRDFQTSISQYLTNKQMAYSEIQTVSGLLPGLSVPINVWQDGGDFHVSVVGFAVAINGKWYDNQRYPIDENGVRTPVIPGSLDAEFVTYGFAVKNGDTIQMRLMPPTADQATGNGVGGFVDFPRFGKFNTMIDRYAWKVQRF